MSPYRSLLLALVAAAVVGPAPAAMPQRVTMAQLAVTPSPATTPGEVVASVPFYERAPELDANPASLAISPTFELGKGKVWLGWTPERLIITAFVPDGSLVSTRNAETTSTDAAILDLGAAELFFSSTRGNRPIFKQFLAGRLDRSLFHRRLGPEGTRTAVRRNEERGEVTYQASIPWLTLSGAFAWEQPAIVFRCRIRDRQADTTTDLELRPAAGAHLALALAPPAGGGIATLITSARDAVPPGEDPQVTVSFFRSHAAIMPAVVVSLDGSPVCSGNVRLEAGRSVYALRGLVLDPGSHQLSITASGRAIGAIDLAGFDPRAARHQLEALGGRVSALESKAGPPGLASAQLLAREISENLARPRISAILAGRVMTGLDELAAAVARLEGGKPVFEGLTGPLHCAKRSALDQALEPYSLFVPSSARPGPRPLLLVLHPADEDETACLEEPALRAAAQKLGCLVACPGGRGLDATYKGPCELDVWETLEDVSRLYAVDAGRIWIAGRGEGGTAALELALAHPDRLAGAGALDALPDRVATWTHEWRKEPISWLSTLLDNGGAMAGAKNAGGLPVFLSYPAVAPYKDQNRKLGGALKDAGAVSQTHESSSPPAGPTTMWQPMLSFFGTHPRLHDANRVSFATTRPGNRAWWVRLDASSVFGLESSVKAERSPDGRTFKAETQNVLELSMSASGTPLATSDKVEVTLDGQALTEAMPAGGWLIFHRESDKWTAGPRPPRPLKAGKVAGPIGDAFVSRFVFVYADRGAAAKAAESSARESARRWALAYEGHASVRSESSLRSEDEDGNLVLFGMEPSSPRISAALSAVGAKIVTAAISVGKNRFDGRSLAVELITPNLHNPSRYVVVVSGNAPEALSYFAGHDWRKPDWLVADSNYLEDDPQSAQGGGFFDRNWQPTQ